MIAPRYSAATALEDALDLLDRDRDAAAMALGQAVWLLAQCRVTAEPGWLPRAKDLYARLSEIDPESAKLALKASSAAPLDDRFEAARELAMRVVGSEGFFEWASPRETFD